MFDIFQTIDLSVLGDAWKDCYLKFRPITINQLSEISSIGDDKEKSAEVLLSILEGKFVEGKAMKDGVQVAVKKEDLKEFPFSVINDIVIEFTNGLSKKKLSQSGTASEE